MNFRHTRNNDIRINDVVYDLADVLAAVPTYKLPIGVSHSEIDDNPRVFDGKGNQYKAYRDYVALVGEVVNSLPAIKAAQEAKEAVLIQEAIDLEASEYKVLPRDEKRRREYTKQGATIDNMIVALWEKIVEGRSTKADALELIRQQVKVDIK